MKTLKDVVQSMEIAVECVVVTLISTLIKDGPKRVILNHSSKRMQQKKVKKKVRSRKNLHFNNNLKMQT